MKYLIYYIADGTPTTFMSNYFDFENNFIQNCNMIIYNLQYLQYTTDGVHWYDIPENNL